MATPGPSPNTPPPALAGRDPAEPWGTPIIRSTCPSCGRVADRKPGSWTSYHDGRLLCRMACWPATVDPGDDGCWRTWDAAVAGGAA